MKTNKKVVIIVSTIIVGLTLWWFLLKSWTLWIVKANHDYICKTSNYECEISCGTWDKLLHKRICTWTKYYKTYWGNTRVWCSKWSAAQHLWTAGLFTHKVWQWAGLKKSGNCSYTQQDSAKPDCIYTKSSNIGEFKLQCRATWVNDIYTSGGKTTTLLASECIDNEARTESFKTSTQTETINLITEAWNSSMCFVPKDEEDMQELCDQSSTDHLICE